ncbi:FAD-dependent oxidoreductase [Glycomyces sp. A-F 0318]|uniref:NAD(P)/FAD-dependent oxidoreductase n=1 Tax=Glycomyces amatae TaxID=2881355 RepID=UPI001E2E602E|nr:FAD-dependent oxidoreductase [Glycomyces amatae]MCD0443274.1 FAD-dependent oxidoreductase [Glycomyces amatae]
MKHRVLVLGAGYAGAYTAGCLARRLAPADASITVVNAEPDFVERMRNHQVAAGQDLRRRPLAEMFAGTGVDLRIARVTALDPGARTVAVAGDGGAGELGYDTLVYALGSAAADGGVPGVAEHAFHVTSRPAALRLRAHLDGLAPGSRVLVVGEGLTGIETATELAESRPHLAVAMAARGEPGAWLSDGARRHLRRAFERLGVEVRTGTAVERVEPGRAVAAGGVIEAEAVVWAGGFAVHPVAAASGLEVTGTGQIAVDATMRSVSHPDVYAAGDSVHAIGANGRPLPMSCASAGFTSMQAVNAIVGRLTGRRVAATALLYYGNHISLGRRDAIFQFVDREANAKSWYLGGQTAARLKNAVLKGSAWSEAHPTFGMPKRRHRLAGAAERAGEALAA